MAKQHIPALDFMRGIGMLGVLGIHTGAYSLSNPHVNVHLFALLEIVSRFCVPIFFFISAFGLFIGQNVFASFDYKQFLKRRIKTVLLPYIAWSLIYMLHYSITNNTPWLQDNFGEQLFFGLASYHLYFLVILLWFYILMPLWRTMVRKILASPKVYLGILLFVQIMFNYYSSYIVTADFSNIFLNNCIRYRLNYWVLHYVFIFLTGAVCAVRFEQFKQWLLHSGTKLCCFAAFSFTIMLSSYYWLLFYRNYSPENAVDTIHQLSPAGVLYTLGATLFLFYAFTKYNLPKQLANTLSLLGKHSYLIYLIHPLVMYQLIIFLNANNMLMTALTSLSFLFITLLISMLFSLAIEQTGKRLPWVSLLLSGTTGRTAVTQDQTAKLRD